MYFEKKDISKDLLYEFAFLATNKINNTIEELKGGWETTNYLIDKSIVIRFSYMNKSNQYFKYAEHLISNEVNFVNYLNIKQQNELHFAKFDSTDTYFIKKNTAEGIYFITKYGFIQGKQFELSENNIEKIANIFNNIHRLMSYNEVHFEEIDNLVSAMDYREPQYNANLKVVFENYDYYFDMHKVNKSILEKNFKNHKRIFIHNDIKTDNIIEKNGKLTLIDFGDSRYSIIEEDLGVFIWGMAVEISDLNTYKSLVNQFLSYYATLGNIFNKDLCYRYAIDRFLNINLYYLNYNLNDDDKLSKQIIKFYNEIQYINCLYSLISDNEKQFYGN